MQLKRDCSETKGETQREAKRKRRETDVQKKEKHHLCTHSVVPTHRKD